MADTTRREHERIEIAMPTRLWLDENHQGRAILFEGFAKTFDLSIGGCYVTSSYILPVGCPINLEMTTPEGDILSGRGEVIHGEDDDPRGSGMGIIFTSVDATNRERLLRFFISDRIRDFYHEKFVVEFPHLEGVLTLKDIALTINLWEDKEGRVAALHAPRAATPPAAPTRSGGRATPAATRKPARKTKTRR